MSFRVTQAVIVESAFALHNWRSIHIRNSFLNTSFDWRLIPSFLAALEHGSLLGAARALRSSQPTLGRHIAELEDQLGVVLFERTGRGLKPTPMALQLAGSAQAMEDGAHALRRSVSGASEQVCGTVRLSASQPVACYLLPPVLAGLRRAWPEIQIELVVSNEISNLLRREADIALRMVRPEQSSLVTRHLGEVALCACAHRDYLRRHGTPRHLEDLLSHELIGADRHEAVLRGFLDLGHPVTPEHFAFRTDDLIAYWEAVRAGLGVGFVARYLLRLDAQVQEVLAGMPLPTLPIWLTVHREISGSRPIRAVYDFLAGHLPAALAPTEPAPPTQ